MDDSYVERLSRAYPRIFFACHLRHSADPEARVRLSSQQATIIDHLDEHWGVTLGWLAKHMDVTSATASIAVERLVKRGLVRRDRSADDRRQLQLRLTPEGAAIKNAESVLDEGLVRRMLERLSENDRKEALRGLELLARAAEEQIQGRSAWSNPAEVAGSKR